MDHHSPSLHRPQNVCGLSLFAVEQGRAASCVRQDRARPRGLLCRGGILPCVISPPAAALHLNFSGFVITPSLHCWLLHLPQMRAFNLVAVAVHQGRAASSVRQDGAWPRGLLCRGGVLHRGAQSGGSMQPDCVQGAGHPTQVGTWS